MDLIADIGATNTRCALLNDKGQELASEVFQNADFTGVLGLLNVYLDHRRASDRPKRAALAIAAPILGDEVHMVNRDWRFSQTELRKQLGVNELIVCNDFAAVAWGLPQLRAGDLKQIGGGKAAERGAMATLGPGTGLGVAALVPAAEVGWAVVSGEGGHASMSAVTDEEHRVLQGIRKRYGNCSAERLLSGPGLVNLYVALAELAGRGQPTVMPRDVTSLAKQGEPLARKAQAMFFAMLGTVAGDLALTVGARGGLFIAGGIVPQLLEPIAKSEFRERFEAKDGYRDYMRGIPTQVITNRVPAFRGLRQLLGYR